MRLDKIYTKVGDKGRTYLADGSKVEKHHARLEAYGDIDELNSVFGLLADKLAQLDPSSIKNPKMLNLITDLEFIRWIQHRLFDIGGELATPADKINLELQQVVTARDVSTLESHIDSMNEQLTPLKNFVLPGGNELNSVSHLARCVCRRAERQIYRFHAEQEDTREDLRVFVNRLSDWLFVFSRAASQAMGIEEIIWKQNKSAAST